MSEQEINKQSKKYMQSLRKALLALKCFNLQRTEMNSAEIARIIGVHHSTAYRIISALQEENFLERNVRTGKYRIGPELYILGSLYLTTTDILIAAEPVIKTINNLTNEAVSVSIFDNGNVILIMKEESRSTFRFSDHIGSIIPAHASAMGKAFLSERSEEELDRLFPEEKLTPVTKHTLTTKTELKRELRQIKQSGISFDPQGAHDNVLGIGALIRNSSGQDVAALAIPIPIFRTGQGYPEKLATLAKMGASLVSYRLGFQDQAMPIRDLQDIRSWWERQEVVES